MSPSQYYSGTTGWPSARVRTSLRACTWRDTVFVRAWAKILVAPPRRSAVLRGQPTGAGSGWARARTLANLGLFLRPRLTRIPTRRRAAAFQETRPAGFPPAMGVRYAVHARGLACHSIITGRFGWIIRGRWTNGSRTLQRSGPSVRPLCCAGEVQVSEVASEKGK